MRKIAFTASRFGCAKATGGRRGGRVLSVRQSGLFVPLSDWKLPPRVRHGY